MPDPALLTERGREWLESLPVPLRDDPDVQAVIHVQAREADRREEYLTAILDGFFPQRAAELGLRMWEVLLRLRVAPPGWTVQQRRDAVLAALRSLPEPQTGRGWERTAEKLVGQGFTYQEHDPAAPAEPPPYTILVELPFPAGAPQFEFARTVLRRITPAAWSLTITSGEGFTLDRSQLDQDTFSE